MMVVQAFVELLFVAGAVFVFAAVCAGLADLFYQRSVRRSRRRAREIQRRFRENMRALGMYDDWGRPDGNG